MIYYWYIHHGRNPWLERKDNVMKRKMFIVLLTGVLLSVSACSNSSSTDASQSDNQKNEQQDSDSNNGKNENKDEENKADQVTDDSNKNDNQAVQEDESAEITIYTSNDDATAFVSESVKIDELTPENIVNALVQKSVLSSDVQACNNRINTSQTDAINQIRNKLHNNTSLLYFFRYLSKSIAHEKSEFNLLTSAVYMPAISFADTILNQKL